MSFPIKMGGWDYLVGQSIGLATTNPQTQASYREAWVGGEPWGGGPDYVYTHAVLYGKPKATEVLSISRHTFWNFLNRGHAGSAVPRAVLTRAGGSAEALEEAEERQTIQAQVSRRLGNGGPVAERRAPCLIPLRTLSDCCAPRYWSPRMNSPASTAFPPPPYETG